MDKLLLNDAQDERILYLPSASAESSRCDADKVKCVLWCLRSFSCFCFLLCGGSCMFQTLRVS